MRIIERVLKTIISIIEILMIAMISANIWVFSLTNGRTFSKISRIPKRETALVLGTSPKMRSGIANPYFVARMEAVATLYHYQKINKIIVSGEKSEGYDEPKAMKNYLISQEGVPSEIIIEDPKGFSTKESINNCKTVFKETSVIIVSQGYHNLRALFYARNNGMNALGFDAQDVLKKESFYRNQGREFLARVRAVVFYWIGED